MQAVGFVKFELGQIAILRQLHPRDVQTLLPVEWSRLAIQSQPAEVIQTVSEIGILLHLEKDESRTKSMHRPRRDENSFLGFRVEGLNEVARSPVLEGSF